MGKKKKILFLTLIGSCNQPLRADLNAPLRYFSLLKKLAQKIQGATLRWSVLTMSNTNHNFVFNVAQYSHGFGFGFI